MSYVTLGKIWGFLFALEVLMYLTLSFPPLNKKNCIE